MGERRGPIPANSMCAWLPSGQDVYAVCSQECLDPVSFVRDVALRLGPGFLVVQSSVGSGATGLGYHGFVVLVVAVRSSLVEAGIARCSEARVRTVQLGRRLPVGRAANKGAVGITVPLMLPDEDGRLCVPSALTFVGAHLAADSKGRSRAEQRHADVAVMLARLGIAVSVRARRTGTMVGASGSTSDDDDDDDDDDGDDGRDGSGGGDSRGDAHAADRGGLEEGGPDPPLRRPGAKASAPGPPPGRPRRSQTLLRPEAPRRPGPAGRARAVSAMPLRSVVEAATDDTAVPASTEAGDDEAPQAAPHRGSRRRLTNAGDLAGMDRAPSTRPAPLTRARSDFAGEDDDAPAEFVPIPDLAGSSLLTMSALRGGPAASRLQPAGLGEAPLPPSLQPDDDDDDDDEKAGGLVDRGGTAPLLPPKSRSQRVAAASGRATGAPVVAARPLSVPAPGPGADRRQSVSRASSSAPAAPPTVPPSRTYAVVLGDLNYRLRMAPEQAVRATVAAEAESRRGNVGGERPWHRLLVVDELRDAIGRGAAFAGFTEAAVCFPPTYRRRVAASAGEAAAVDRATGVFEDVDAVSRLFRVPGPGQPAVKPSKLRTPSYTDRVLLRRPNTARPRLPRALWTSYRSCESLQGSDHVPVGATLAIDMTRRAARARLRSGSVAPAGPSLGVTSALAPGCVGEALEASRRADGDSDPPEPAAAVRRSKSGRITRLESGLGALAAAAAADADFAFTDSDEEADSDDGEAADGAGGSAANGRLAPLGSSGRAADAPSGLPPAAVTREVSRPTVTLPAGRLDSAEGPPSPHAERPACEGTARAAAEAMVRLYRMLEGASDGQGRSERTQSSPSPELLAADGFASAWPCPDDGLDIAEAPWEDAAWMWDPLGAPAPLPVAGRPSHGVATGAPATPAAARAADRSRPTPHTAEAFLSASQFWKQREGSARHL